MRINLSHPNAFRILRVLIDNQILSEKYKSDDIDTARIAEIVGLRRETVSRYIAAMCKAGYIVTQNHGRLTASRTVTELGMELIKFNER